MDEIQLEAYKQKLEKERTLLLNEIKQFERPTDFGHDTESPDEETDATEALGNQLAMANDLKIRLDEIDIALGKIYAGRSGKYGVCEKCERAIGRDVTDAAPESRLCKRCKSGG